MARRLRGRILGWGCGAKNSGKGKNSSLSRIEVVDEVWVQSSPKGEEPSSNL